MADVLKGLAGVENVSTEFVRGYREYQLSLGWTFLSNSGRREQRWLTAGFSESGGVFYAGSIFPWPNQHDAEEQWHLRCNVDGVLITS
jgi:hypothetical protein